MGYERDDSTRWGNWPHTNMVQAVKSMGARHNGREPYISFTIGVSKPNLQRCLLTWLLVFAFFSPFFNILYALKKIDCENN